MLRRPFISKNRPLSAILALLWGMYAVLGAAGLCRTTSCVMALRSHGSAASRSPACVCLRCHRLLRAGAHCGCCKTGRTPSPPNTLLQARCDQGAPAVLAAVTDWPVVAGPVSDWTPPALHGGRFARPANRVAWSSAVSPWTPPPLSPVIG